MSESTKIHADLCVIGGGISGIAAAVFAARNGLKTVLIHDRNVLGGNASSEIRMWIRGASSSFPQYREGGIVEELALDNMHYNPAMNFSLWDAVLYNKVISEKNITLLLGTTCIGAKANGNLIENIQAWQLNSYRKYIVEATYFADCSGDCILSEFINADTMIGRESKETFHEPFAPDAADDKTMGNSCLIQLKSTDAPTKHVPFPFERDIPESLYTNRMALKNPDLSHENFWWVETGGTRDTVKDAGEINRELIRDILSVWNGIEQKNPDLKWELNWIGFLQGKRESRRYRGDYVLTANDILANTPFEDGIAYGGWPMDDHDPRGMYADKPNHNYYFSAPYSIPYRCIYSNNIENLFFAGRNISVSHLALSSTRVMATCGAIGQALGAAAAVAKKYKTSPRGASSHIAEIQQILTDADCYLPQSPRKTSFALRNAATDHPVLLKTMIDSAERKLEKCDPVLSLRPGESFSISFPKTFCKALRIVFDSDFERKQTDDIMLKLFPMPCCNASEKLKMHTPETLVKDFRVEWISGEKKQIREIKDNFQRLAIIPVNEEIDSIIFTGQTTHGCPQIRLYSLDILH